MPTPGAPSLLKSISPAPFRRNDGTDPKWKQYCASVDRALAVWDSVQEWADHISFLSKLQKALKPPANSNFARIPSAPVVALRLANCLDPGLPSGVHKRALEVYNFIFDLISGQELHQQVSIWLPGLLPLMSYASINVKPALIDLFEHHILPLPSLRNILKPILLSFLPGIDDESSESFDQVLKLIEDVKLKVNDDSHFWQCLFLIAISSSDRRPGALVWMNKNFPSFTSTTSVSDIEQNDIPGAYQSLSYNAQMAATPETGLLIRAFSKGLQDSQSLVQRGFLELLVCNLELQSPLLQIIASKQDLKLLLVSACSTVLRRDMSLNRRLWIWLLGPDRSGSNTAPESNVQHSSLEYFAKFALDPLAEGLLEMINRDPTTVTAAELTRPYKICLSILDRWEIGVSIVPRVLLPAIRSVRNYVSVPGRTRAESDEAIRSAGALFDGVEAIHIWGDCVSLISSKSSSDLELFLFILEVFNVRDEEMVVNHLPLVLLALLHLPRDEDMWFKAVSAVLDLIPERAFLPIQHATQLDLDSTPLDLIDRYYHAPTSVNNDDEKPPLSPATLSALVLSQLAKLTCESLRRETCTAGKLAKFLSQLLEKIPEQQSWRNDELVEVLVSLKKTSNAECLLGIVDLFVTISDSFTYAETDAFLFSISGFLFTELSVPTGSYQVELVQSIWAVHEKLEGQRVQSAFATLFTDKYDFAAKTRVFSVIWRHSINRINAEVVLGRCLYLFLDQLAAGSEASFLVSNWLVSVEQSGMSGQLLRLIVQPLIAVDEQDVPMYTYHAKVVTAVLKAAPGMEATCFREGLTIDGKQKTYSQILVSSLVDLIKIHTGKPTSSLTVCFDLLELCMPRNETELASLVASLLELTEKQVQLDASSLSHIGLLRVLHKALARLDGLSPSWHNSFLNELVTAEDSSDSKFSIARTLFQCLINGLTKCETELSARRWTEFLTQTLKLFDISILQVVIPLVDCICNRITSLFASTTESLGDDTKPHVEVYIFYHLMDALEKVLIMSYDRLGSEESRMSSPKNAADPGFFGNVISGVFTVESPVTRSAWANDRLTVLLCFQDTIRTGCEIWRKVEALCRPSSNPSDSLVYILPPLKSRTRKLLGKICRLEPLECLECFMKVTPSGRDIFRILHVLDGSRPKLTIPHIFKSLTSRVNSASVEASERSTLTTDLTEVEICNFLVEYLSSLEDDAIEDIWNDCMGFVREVQVNQAIYRKCLPMILQFMAIMAEKVDSIKFGEQRKSRKDLSDLFMKLLHFAVSSRSPALPSAPSPAISATSGMDPEKSSTPGDASLTPSTSTVSLPLVAPAPQAELTKSLESVLTHLRVLVSDQDRAQAALADVVSNLLSPVLLKQKTLTSVPSDLMSLLGVIVDIPSSQKTWKSMVGDVFLDTRFLGISKAQAKQWMPIINRWGQTDRDRVKDYMSRVSSFGTNSNVLFGWSAEESVVQSQNLDRLAYLFLCGGRDGFGANFNELMDKIESLSVGRTVSHAFTCLRAIIVSVDPEHLTPLWTFLYSRLSMVFREFAAHESDVDLDTIVSACKLLDATIALSPENFQPYEWLFICDNMDAIFRSEDHESYGLIDQIAQSNVMPVAKEKLEFSFSKGVAPMLSGRTIETLVDLRPFFDQLSIFAYEGLYSLEAPDVVACREDILSDIFN